MTKKTEETLKDADFERVEGYMHMFDRVLLYTMAANNLSQKTLDATIKFWDVVIKKTIDLDATQRTDFLEKTLHGRTAKLRDEPDGEDIRLHSLKQWKIAKQVIENNLRKLESDSDTEDDQSY